MADLHFEGSHGELNIVLHGRENGMSRVSSGDRRS